DSQLSGIGAIGVAVAQPQSVRRVLQGTRRVAILGKLVDTEQPDGWMASAIPAIRDRRKAGQRTVRTHSRVSAKEPRQGWPKSGALGWRSDIRTGRGLDE